MNHFIQLKDAIQADDLFRQEQILEALEGKYSSRDYVYKLYRFIENNPELDYGTPGPIVHCIERSFSESNLQEYESLLFDSISRRPTVCTVRMLNRLMNYPDLKDEDWFHYIEVMELLASDNHEYDDVRRLASNYLQYHTR